MVTGTSDPLGKAASISEDSRNTLHLLLSASHIYACRFSRNLVRLCIIHLTAASARLLGNFEINLDLSPFLKRPNFPGKKLASTKRLIDLINLSSLLNHLKFALLGRVSGSSRNALRSNPVYEFVHMQG